MMSEKGKDPSRFAEAKETAEGKIVVTVEDKEVLKRAKTVTAFDGDTSNRALVEVGTGIAERAIVEELKKTGAYNPKVETTAEIDTKFPVQL